MTTRRLSLIFAVLLSIAIGGCAGGSNSVPGAGPTVAHSNGPAAHKKSKQSLSEQAIGPCPQQAVFLRLPGEIRGYATSGSGWLAPCTDVVGPTTQLTGNGNGYGAIAISVHGDLHALAFQSNGYGGLMIFAPTASGDIAPFRSILVSQDHVALAVDSQVNDFVVGSENYEGDNCWYVVPNPALTTSSSNCDTNLSTIYALAITPKDELVVLGADAVTSATRIDIFSAPASATPALVRSIAGSATGLPQLSSGYFSYSYSLATDPVLGTIYVLSADATGVSLPKIAEFGAAATGNVAPLLTLSGALTQLPAQTFAINVLSVDTSSNLYVNATGVFNPEVWISVFAPGAAGNTAPVRTIIDDTLLNPGNGGIAVRS